MEVDPVGAPHVLEMEEFHLEGGGDSDVDVLGPGPLTRSRTYSFPFFFSSSTIVLLLTAPLPARDRVSVQPSRIIHSEKVIESTIRSGEQERLRPTVIPASVFQRWSSSLARLCGKVMPRAPDYFDIAGERKSGNMPKCLPRYTYIPWNEVSCFLSRRIGCCPHESAAKATLSISY